jgi:hypothetical protein
MCKSVFLSAKSLVISPISVVDLTAVWVTKEVSSSPSISVVSVA